MLAAAAVALGAFGAHGAKARLSTDMLAVWQTAVQYHAWHTLGVLVVGLCPDGGWMRAAGWLLVAGILLFSGTLYGLAFGAPRWLGAVTPIGGVAFILGWIAFAIGVIYAKTPG